jgi:hypothetical protein
VIGRLVSVAAPPIGAKIMHYYGPYLAFFLTVPASAVPLIPLMLLPETAKLREPSATMAESEQTSGPAKNPTVRMRLRTLKAHILNDFVPLLKSVPILIGLISFVIGSFATAIGEIIMQYIKVRFGWDYEKACVVT